MQEIENSQWLFESRPKQSEKLLLDGLDISQLGHGHSEYYQGNQANDHHSIKGSTIIHKNLYPSFGTIIYFIKLPLNVKIVQQDLHHRK